MGIRCADHVTPLYPQKLALTSPTGGGRSVGIFRSRTKATVFSSAPEDGQNDFPKHVELTGIINKPLLLHLVGCLYYLYQRCTIKQISDNEIYLLIKYIKKRSLESSETPVLIYRMHGA